MPIHAGNENQDTIGDALKTPGRGYDPYQWQDAANGQGKNRVLIHQGPLDIKELIEPQPPVSTLIAEMPEAVVEGRKAIEKHIENSPELKPYVDEFLAEAKAIIDGRMAEGAPNVAPIHVFRTAEERVRKSHGLPLEKPAPLSAPARVPTLDDEMTRLEAEARKVRTEVGQDFAPVRQAIIEMTPAPKRRK